MSASTRLDAFARSLAPMISRVRCRVYSNGPPSGSAGTSSACAIVSWSSSDSTHFSTVQPPAAVLQSKSSASSSSAVGAAVVGLRLSGCRGLNDDGARVSSFSLIDGSLSAAASGDDAEPFDRDVASLGFADALAAALLGDVLLLVVGFAVASFGAVGFGAAGSFARAETLPRVDRLGSRWVTFFVMAALSTSTFGAGGIRARLWSASCFGALRG